MQSRIDLRAREVSLVLSLRCYDREAVTQAAIVFSRRSEFFLERESKDVLEVTLQAREGATEDGLRKLAGEFLNEVLNQDLRIGVVKKNKRVIQILTAHALRVASGDVGKAPLDREVEKNLQDEAARLMAEGRLPAAGGAK